MPPRRLPPASPARSTRSTRSARGRDDDDWEGDSVATNTSFKVPNSRNGRNTNGNGLIGLKDTSVNIAAAFHAAQTGSLPTPISDRAFPRRSKTPVASSSSQRHATPRAQSPAEQLASAAKALSPVKFFLQHTNDYDNSGDYTSFSSLGGDSGETSYDYMQEEEYVRQAQAKAKSKPIPTGPRLSDIKKRSKRAMDDEMPYRPGEEDDESYDSDEGDEVESAGGHDFGDEVTPAVTRDNLRRRTRKNDGSDGEYDQRGWTPAADINGHRRSPTPAQLLRALSPRVDRRSPVPTFHSRKRKPSSLRTIVTNILHGLVITLRFVVDLVTSILRNVIVAPGQAVFGSGRDIARRLKKDWWKWLGALLALSLLLRLLDATRRSGVAYHAPTALPGSMDELVARLTSVEQQLHELSTKSQTLTEADTEVKQSSHRMQGRVDDLESAVMLERKRIEGLHGDSKSVRALQQSFDTLKAEVDTLATRVTSQEKTVATAQKAVQSIEAVDREVQALKSRVTEVEQGVKDALDDGRLRAGLDRILPRSLPVKFNSRGTVDIEPVFWAEMKKVLMGQTETEALVRRLLAEASPSAQPQSKNFSLENEEKLEAWMDKVFERKSHSGAIISHDSFIKLLERNLAELREELVEKIGKTIPPGKAAPSSVTIKSGKGDDLTTLFNDLIDTALLKYSKDTIARADYALFTAGARVIPSLTSDTLVIQPASKIWKRISGGKDVEGRPPATALHPDISVGSCWPFAGQSGSLGVSLTSRVHITDITIEHAPSELALSTSTAPRDVAVFGLLDESDVEGKTRLEEYWAELEDSTTPKGYLPLGNFTYDTSAASHIQTFPIPPDVVGLGIKVSTVVFQIESNWGGEFTCLYRVRVHGETE